MDSYDSIADIYDTLFDDDYSMKENRAIANMLTPYLYNKSILDIGCGTGLLLDMFSLKPDKYIGIDPSEKMLDIAREKHPPFLFKQEKFEEYIGYTDVAVSLFGSMNYVDIEYQQKILQICNRYFLMYYKDGYFPQTYKATGLNPNKKDITYNDLCNLFWKYNIFEFNNFYILTSLF